MPNLVYASKPLLRTFPNSERLPQPQDDMGSRQSGPWWLPFGFAMRFGEGCYRWYLVGFDPLLGEKWLFSGRLDLVDEVGILLNEDLRMTPVDPGYAYQEDGLFVDFPFAHCFYDPEAKGLGEGTGIWFCLDGHIGSSRHELAKLCHPSLLQRLSTRPSRTSIGWYYRVFA